MHLRFWNDCLLHLSILALFKDVTHCGAEQRVMEKFSAGVDSPWSWLCCVRRRTDDVKSLSQRSSHPTYCTAQHSILCLLSSLLSPALLCTARWKQLQWQHEGAICYRFFSSAESSSITGKWILGLPSRGSGGKASPVHPGDGCWGAGWGVGSRGSWWAMGVKYEEFKVCNLPAFSTVICDVPYYGRGIWP